MYHTDKTLNKLYSQIAKLDAIEDTDKIMSLLDKIFARREALGEI